MKPRSIILALVMLGAATLAWGQNTELTDTSAASSLRDTTRLNAATVTARKELVKTDAEKLTYNVEADPLVAGSSLIEVLRRVPMLSVDSEEIVRLNGSTDYRVLVNGRPTGMLARNFDSLIKSFPASSVKEIQVITNPQVKYDAEGVGGIINIVTSRKLKAGYSGTLSTHGTSLGGAGLGGFGSVRAGKLTVSTNLSGSHSPTPLVHGKTTVENFGSEALRGQVLDFSSGNTYDNGAFSLEGSYEADSLNLFTLSGWVNMNRYRSELDVLETFRDVSGVKTMVMEEPTLRIQRPKTFSGEAAWQKTFRDDGGSLTFSYSIDGNPSTVDNDVVMIPLLNRSDYHRHSFNTERTVQQMAQVDYYATLKKKHRIESGVKYTLRSHVADSKDELWDFTSERWVIDNSNVNDLDYDQHIFAAYASYGRKFGSLTLKAGSRAEYTLNRGLSKSASQNQEFDNSNFNIVPYLNAAWQMDRHNSLAVTYTRRLGRPSVHFLNPYIYEETPTSLIHGNPDLRTVVSDALTLTYRTEGDKWNLMARTYGSLCSNKIEYLSTIRPDGVKVSTYENAVTWNHLDGLISASWDPSSWLGFRASARVGYEYFHAPSSGQTNDGPTYSFELSSNIGLWKRATGFVMADFSGGEITLQRSFKGYEYSYVLGLRQGLLQNRLSVTAMASMPFQNYYSGSVRHSEGPGFHQVNYGWVNPRMFHLALSWRFGGTSINLKKARKSVVDDKL